MLVVPSLVYETFGYVVLEAFHEGTPVVVRDLGALPELVNESGGGLVFDSLGGLIDAIDRIVADPTLRNELGANGRAARRGIWSEEEHLKRYFDLIEGRGASRKAHERRRSAGRVKPAKPAASQGPRPSPHSFTAPESTPRNR